MRITVPATVRRYPYAGIAGLGQDDSGGDVFTTYDPDTTTDYTSSLPLFDTSLTTTDILTPLDTDTVSIDGTTYSLSPVSAPVTPSPAVASATGPVSQSGAAATPTTSGLSNLCTSASCQQTGPTPTAAQLAGIVQSGTSSGLTAAQISQIFTSAAQAGVAVFKATSSPSLVPGTNLVYNPATGQLMNALTGLTGTQIAALGGMSVGTILLIGGALLLVLMLTKK